ncbi:MAG: hypothetical protein HOP11_11675 [Saprospiraceae bacterium]|nr:hypothetical protein [Saprospiraceae bacterium]
MKKNIIFLGLLLIGNMIVGQSAIRNSVIGTGASHMSSSSLNLKGTLGQAIINKTATSALINEQGFWSGYSRKFVSVDNQKMNSKIQITLFPNLISNSSTLQFSLSSSQEIRIEIINNLGIKYPIYDNYIVPDGHSSLSLPLENLQSGTYFLHIYNQDFGRIIPFIKLN